MSIRDASNELAILQVVLAVLSVIALICALLVMTIFKRYTQQVERLMLALTVSNLALAGTLVIPAFYNNKQLLGETSYCNIRASTYGTQICTIFLEIEFIASTLLTVKRNQFIPFKTEVAAVVVSSLVGLVVWFFSHRFCLSTEFLRFENAFSFVVVGSLFSDALLCLLLLVSIRQKDNRFKEQQGILLDHIAEQNSRRARRQLQLLDQTHREFQAFFKPLKY